MKSEVETDRVLRCAQQALKEDIRFILENKRSDRNLVITVNDGERDLIVKAGLDVETDNLALDILGRIDFPSPKALSYSSCHIDGIDYGILVMSKLNGVQTRSLQLEKRWQVVSTLIDQLQKLRLFKSEGGAGSLKAVRNGCGLTWGAYLARVVDEAVRDLEIINPMSTVSVDRGSILSAVEIVRLGIAELPEDLDINLLHNDLNLANCIAVDGQFVGIVDWSDAIYGEYLYDVARLRMNLEQSGDEKSLEVYRLKVRMSPEENRRELLYYLCRLIEYLGIYNKYGDDYWFDRNQQLLTDFINDIS